MKKFTFVVSLLLLFGVTSCKQNTKKEEATTGKTVAITYAKGFTIEKFETYTLLTVKTPWPNAEKPFTYALVHDKNTVDATNFDAVIQVPVKTTVATSTTHIPALEALHAENSLVAFPSTQYISSEKTRARIDAGFIKEAGINESLNTEILLDTNPDVVFGFSINGQNKAYTTLEHAGIPVVYNGDWAEQTPLGKAEWIKFFAPFFEKEKEANSIFNGIATNYNDAKKLADKYLEKPTVLSGAMFNDVWYVPGGNSWMAQFLKDANATYLWENNLNTGSLSLSFESVYDQAQNADFWIGPGQFLDYETMKNTNSAYADFKAFETQQAYTYSKVKGATGGLLFYELAPNRPDMVLKDLIHILHKDALPSYTPYFFKPLE